MSDIITPTAEYWTTYVFGSPIIAGVILFAFLMLYGSEARMVAGYVHSDDGAVHIHNGLFGSGNAAFRHDNPDFVHCRNCYWNSSFKADKALSFFFKDRQITIYAAKSIGINTG